MKIQNPAPRALQPSGLIPSVGVLCGGDACGHIWAPHKAGSASQTGTGSGPQGGYLGGAQRRVLGLNSADFGGSVGEPCGVTGAV